MSSIEHLFTKEDQATKLLEYNAQFKGVDISALIDSGASRNFIDQDFVNSHGLKTKKMISLSVKVTNGSDVL